MSVLRTTFLGENTSIFEEASTQNGKKDSQNFASAYLDNKVTYTLLLTVPPVLLVSGCFGNVMTIVVMRAMRASESTACLSVYFTALAVSDLFVLNTNVIWVWPEMVLNTPVVYFHHLSCISVYYVSFVSSMTSAWCLMAMTCQRLTSVLLPHRVGVLCTVRRGVVVTVVIVVSACLINSYAFFTFRVIDLGNDYKVCVNTDTAHTHIYRLVQTILASVIPFLFLIMANVVLIYNVKQSIHLSHQMSGTQKTNTPTTTTTTTTTTQRADQVSSMTTTLILTSVAFLVLTLPMCILTMYLDAVGFFEGKIEDESWNQTLALLETVCVLVWTSNSVVNFYIYILSGRKFREETKRCLCRLFRCQKAGM